MPETIQWIPPSYPNSFPRQKEYMATDKKIQNPCSGLQAYMTEFLLHSISYTLPSEASAPGVSVGSVQSLCCVRLFATPWTPGIPVHHQLPELAQTQVHWVGDVIQPSCPLVIPFSSCLQSFPASGSFLMNQFFTSGGQSIEGSGSAISPFNEHSGLTYFMIEWLDLLALKGLSEVFSNNTVQKHQFFSTQLSFWSNTDIHTWLLKKPYFDYMDLCWQSNVSAF